MRPVTLRSRAESQSFGSGIPCIRRRDERSQACQARCRKSSSWSRTSRKLGRYREPLGRSSASRTFATGTGLAVAIRPHPRPDQCRKFRCFSNSLVRKRGNEKTEFDVHGARVATGPCSDPNFLSRPSYFLELLGRAQGPTLRPSARLRSRAETYGGTPGLTASLPDG
jgi:hypothetical protein